MSEPNRDGQDNENELRALRKQVARLERKLSVSESHRRRLEHTYDLKTRLLKNHAAEIEQAKADVEALRASAERANTAKSLFLANMSHELRTPLNAILGYSELLAEELQDLEATDLLPDLDKIHTAGRHLLGLINDILDLSKIEAGHLKLSREEIDLAVLCDEVVATTGSLLKRNGNTMRTRLDFDLGEVLIGDQMRVRQILLNLIGNAAKFTHQGTITMLVRSDTEGITFAIADTGIGMSQEQQEQVFEPFMQADETTTKRFGGTGLGLAICRKFTELMGGRIRLASERGRGSTFTIWIPRSPR